MGQDSTLDLFDQRKTPLDVWNELRAFQASAEAFFKLGEDELKEFEQQWVAVLNGTVAAHGDTREEVLKSVKEKQLPRDRIFLRYVSFQHPTYHY